MFHVSLKQTLHYHTKLILICRCCTYITDSDQLINLAAVSSHKSHTDSDQLINLAVVSLHESHAHYHYQRKCVFIVAVLFAVLVLVSLIQFIHVIQVIQNTGKFSIPSTYCACIIAK